MCLYAGERFGQLNSEGENIRAGKAWNLLIQSCPLPSSRIHSTLSHIWPSSLGLNMLHKSDLPPPHGGGL